MIVEVADFRTDPDEHDVFGKALAHAADMVLSKAKGYRSHAVLSCIETPGRHVLTVHWDDVKSHMVGFRESEDFAAWRAIIGPYFIAPPQVEHFNVVVTVPV
ncbi:antibiotic biosynthesis monooxygenase family protein [Sphingomonas sp. NCPPB 2930]